MSLSEFRLLLRPCDGCGTSPALPSRVEEGAGQSLCVACSAQVGKYEQAYAQLDTLVGFAVGIWLESWRHESFVCDLEEHLGQLGSEMLAKVRATSGGVRHA